ncbi:MAG: HAMP domain-containing sensor histidine kinase, partial [Rhodothermales bacterium]
RLEANESGMSPTSVDLTTTAFSVVRDLKKVAEKKDLPLHFKASSPIRAHLDVGALEEIVWNLVDNAIKFTREGSVEVTTGTDGDRAFIRVIDTGVGIGEDFRERMYDAFAQESDGFDRAFEGVGLGLTITRRLVEHMGGEIEVETAVGEGSTFTVYFPVTASVAANGTDPLTAAAAAPQTDAAAASDPATAAANDPATAPEKESPNKPVK